MHNLFFSFIPKCLLQLISLGEWIYFWLYFFLLHDLHIYSNTTYGGGNSIFEWTSHFYWFYSESLASFTKYPDKANCPCHENYLTKTSSASGFVYLCQ